MRVQSIILYKSINMPFDLNSFMAGVAGSIITDKVKDKTTEVVDTHILDNPPKPQAEDYLKEIHELLINFLAWAKHQQTTTGKGDEYTFATIYKSGFGPPFKPQHVSNRDHFVLFSPYNPAIVLNCSGTPLGNFNLTLAVADWKPIDFPDGATYNLDATAPSNSLIFWLRETNAPVV